MNNTLFRGFGCLVIGGIIVWWVNGILTLPVLIITFLGLGILTGDYQSILAGLGTLVLEIGMIYVAWKVWKLYKR